MLRRVLLVSAARPGAGASGGGGVPRRRGRAAARRSRSARPRRTGERSRSSRGLPRRTRISAPCWRVSAGTKRRSASDERALAINPRLTAARLNLGLAHYRAGALAAALEAFQAVHAAEPSLLQARQLLGLVLVELGRDAEAIPHLEASAQAAPDEPAVLFALGRAYSRRGDPRADAIAERLAKTPRGPAVVAPASRARAAARRPPPAGAEGVRGGRGLERRPAAALGERRGQPSGARRSRRRSAAFEDALVRSDRDAAAHVYLGWMDEQDDRLPDARRHAEQAVALEGDLAESRGLLGRILLKQGSPGRRRPPPRGRRRRRAAQPVVALPPRAGLSTHRTSRRRRAGVRRSAPPQRGGGGARRADREKVARQRKGWSRASGRAGQVESRASGRRGSGLES